MTQLTLSIPQTGLPNLTEDPKVANDLIQIQNVVNGNLDTGNFASGLQGLIVADGVAQLVTMRKITGTSASLGAGWQTVSYSFTAFPTLCVMAFAVPGPISNGSNLLAWNMSNFNNGSIALNLQLNTTDTVRVFGIAWGY